MILVVEYLDNRQRRVVVEVDERPVRIGRNPADDGSSDVILRVPWNDRLVNRNHSIARREGDELVVSRLPASPGHHEANRIYSPGSPDSREALEDPLRLKAGDSFVIGRHGRTLFHWLHEIEDLDRKPPAESKDAADSAREDDDDFADFNEYTLRLQLRLLQRELPEKVLSGWTDERDLFIRAAAFLHNAFPGQKRVAAAFVALDPSDDDGEFELLSPDPNTRADFQPSRRLLRKLDRNAANGGGPCIWTPATDPVEFAEAPSLQRTIQWIAAVPVCSLDENAAVYRTPDRRPVYIYVETSYSSNPGANNGRANLPFLRLVAALVASLLSTREKQRIQDQMSAYFSPALREKLSGDQEALEPAMADCTVLFVDRRGSSAMMETARSDDEILNQLRDNQEIVGEITQKVFDHDGVITDFSGDGVLALWGWPPDLESRQHHARLAVEAAAAIAARLESWVEFDPDSQRDLSPIRIGVSTGRLAVGKTGPEQQLHISVFGNVVNLGARLEKIAKGFHLPALLSGETVSRLGDREDRVPNVRRLCYIKPAGFNQSYPIFELVLPRAIGGSGVSPADTEIYERALELFVERQWQEARDLLNQLPEDDRPARWLDRRIEKFQRKPPSDDWQGEIVSLLK